MMGYHIRQTTPGAVVYAVACAAITFHFFKKYMNKSNIVIINSSVVIYHMPIIQLYNLNNSIVTT